jgi:hypothetical protein
MSEHITHIAVYEDSARIFQAIRDEFPKVFLASLRRSYDSGLLCSGARGNHLNAIPIIEKYKNREAGTLKLEETEQIAGAIGWLTHRAADLQMKPLFRIIEDENHPVFSDNECQMYHDAIVFKEVYQGGQVSTSSEYENLSPATLSHRMKDSPVSQLLNVPAVESVFSHYYLNELARLQKLDPNEDITAYADNLIDKSQDMYEDLRIYINAFQSPEYHKLTEYIHNFNVYNSSDPLIKIVRDIQLNKHYPDASEVYKALDTGDQQCQYAQALKKSYDFIKKAGDFFEGKIPKADVYDFLGIYPEEHRI